MLNGNVSGYHFEFICFILCFRNSSEHFSSNVYMSLNKLLLNLNKQIEDATDWDVPQKLMKYSPQIALYVHVNVQLNKNHSGKIYKHIYVSHHR